MSIGLDGTVYAAVSGSLYAVDPNNGSYQVIATSNHSRSVPAVTSSGHLYWGHGDSFVALTPAGEVEWGWTNLSGNFVFGSSPVADEGGNLYVSHDGLWSFMPNGNLRWVYPYGWYGHSSPAIGPDGTIYVSGFLEFLAFDSSGTVKWSLPIVTNDNSAAVAPDGTIYISANGASQTMPARLIALNPDGSTRWSFTLDPSVFTIDMPPAIGLDGTLYVGAGGTFHLSTFSYFYAINPNGTLKWQHRLDGRQNQDWVPFLLAPPLVDRTGNVYYCSHNGSCYGATPEGAILWEIFYPPDAEGIPVWVDTTPLLTEDGKMLILDAHDYLHAYVQPVSVIHLPVIGR
ncbi:MAG: PQQ-like beta-propeller repeat protein [Anaerolineales bacterium]|nr:PQQ-like beta-propeller repeat protein [Anaerolineales bacterium]